MGKGDRQSKQYVWRPEVFESMASLKWKKHAYDRTVECEVDGRLESQAGIIFSTTLWTLLKECELPIGN